MPTLILWGDSDGIFPEPYAHAYRELIPGSQLKVYKNCGHVPMLEARDDFLDRLTAFTQGVS
jgi:pimeloyl-ACP methyl ester carboxylesterase